MEKVGPSMLRSLNQNGVLSLLIDRPTPGKGVRVNFFGEEVEVPAGPARLALRTGATIVAAAFARVDPHRLAVTTLCDFGIRTEASGDDERDIRDLTQAIMDSHERFIRQYPEQWYMFRSMWAREPQGVRS
jgi:KDO2-lipid IV(A) lauroyltransferase